MNAELAHQMLDVVLDRRQLDAEHLRYFSIREADRDQAENVALSLRQLDGAVRRFTNDAGGAAGVVHDRCRPISRRVAKSCLADEVNEIGQRDGAGDDPGGTCLGPRCQLALVVARAVDDCAKGGMVSLQIANQLEPDRHVELEQGNVRI
jgi:hypothetical protein